MWPFKKTTPKAEPTNPPDNPPTGLRVLSFVPPEIVKQIGGLPTEAIYGFMQGEGFSAEQLRPNPPFNKFLHDVIRHHVPNDPAAQAAALRQGTGSLSIIDLRTPEGPHGNVPYEDIIGIFEVRDGVIGPQSYQPNDEYLAFSARGGFISLPPDLQMAFLMFPPRPALGSAPVCHAWCSPQRPQRSSHARIDGRLRAHPAGCLRQSFSLRSNPLSLSLGSLDVACR